VVEGQVEDQPDDAAEVKMLKDLFASELPFGDDGINAVAAIQDLVGSQELEDQLRDDAEFDPDVDARPAIYRWVETNLPDLAAKIEYQPQAG
jgi:hypothetical protein